MGKGEETLSGAVVVLGALAVMAIIVGVAWNYTTKIRYPYNQDGFINGSQSKVASSLAEIINKCWEEHNKGYDKIEKEDCALVKVRSNSNITLEDLDEYIIYEKVKEDIYFSGVIGNRTISLKIVYRGKEGSIVVRKF